MKIPLLDLKAQLEYLEDELIEAVTRVVRSTRYIQGPEVELLEAEIADYCGAAFGVGVSSGTDALLISLMSISIKPGDMVLTTPYSFFATMGVILRMGAVPVFADIDPLSFNISPTLVEKLLKDDIDGKIKAIIPVHLYGQCAEMNTILDLAARHGVPVIEDAAQAIGAEYPGGKKNAYDYKKAGSMGLAGCFSFFPSKNLGGIGDGGMVITQDKDFADKLIMMRNHGAHPKYYHTMVGGNFRLDPIQATALRVKLPYLDKWHTQRAENAHYYNQLFTESGLVEKGIVSLPQEVFSEDSNDLKFSAKTHIYNQYVLRVRQRDDLRDWLLKNDIGCEIYYPVPLHMQKCLLPKLAEYFCPEAEKAASETIALPIYPELTDDMQKYLVDKVLDFYS